MANALPSAFLTSPWTGLAPIYEAARIKPAVVQVEAHPYLPETELLEFRRQRDIVFLAFAPLGHGIKAGASR